MTYQIQMYLKMNPLLKKYLREHSYYYKNLLRNHLFIKELEHLMASEYHLTFTDKLKKMENDLSIFNNIMDIVK